MSIAAISNAPRGCGRKKSGYYLSGGMSPGGMLLPLVWCNGSMIMNSPENNLWFNVPPRKHHAFDAEQSLDTATYVDFGAGRAMRESGDYQGSGKPQLQRLIHANGEPYSLIHHVGNDYTAASKALELARMGPSERVSPITALTVAQYLQKAPVRLFYTHGSVPHVNDGEAWDRLTDYIENEQVEPDDFKSFRLYQDWWALTYGEEFLSTYGDTAFEQPDWRWTMVKDYDGGLRMPQNNGRHHWFARALSYLERHPGTMKDKGVAWTEALYCGTWLTTAMKVLEYEDLPVSFGKTVQPDQLDEEMFLLPIEIDLGIRVAALPPKGEDEW